MFWTTSTKPGEVCSTPHTLSIFGHNIEIHVCTLRMLRSHVVWNFLSATMARWDISREYKLRSLWLLKALIIIVHNILLSAFFLCINYNCRTQRLLCMTEILMCEDAVNKCILEKKIIMDAVSERSQHQWNIHVHWDMHVKDFINSLVKIVMLCLVSLGLKTT